MSSRPRSRALLIIEDDPIDVFLLRNSLATLINAENLVVCDDGAEAIGWLRPLAENLRGQPPAPALIFVDLNLPRVDGLAVISWIRRQPRLAHLPVVAVSGSSDPVDVERAYAVGADDFVSKPATPAVLRQLLCDSGLLPTGRRDGHRRLEVEPLVPKRLA